MQWQAVRGMNDILPDATGRWQKLEQFCREISSQYGYQEIRFPVMEQTSLFQRTIGEVTDIVEKEMYTFPDRHGDLLSLRPEGTAGCVRAVIEHHLLQQQPVQRLWYLGPMFRYERPQKGRCRQFHQFGLEMLGIPGAEADAELILLNRSLWKALGLEAHLQLRVNSLGSLESRKLYREKLISYLNQHAANLDEDSQRRLTTNPLRILDSKNPDTQMLLEKAPKLLDFLDSDSRAHFERFTNLLSAAGIVFEINPRLVRGLDYYNRTVFEWVTDKLGAQGTVCGGGRYDGLLEQLGGPATPAVGFAAGLERLMELAENVQAENAPDIFLVLVGEAALQSGLLLAEELRIAFPKWKIESNLTGGSFKSQFKRADKSGARFAVILAENELANNTVSVKNLRENSEQKTISRDQAISFFSYY